MVRSLWILVAFAGLATFSGVAVAADAEEPARAAAQDEEAVFEMREVSALGVAARGIPNALSILRGQSALCGNEPDREVKAYPKVKSKHPLYGKVKFGANRGGRDSGVEYHFVIDESGEKPLEPKRLESKPGGAKPGEKKAGGTKSGARSSLLDTLASSLLGKTASPPPPAATPGETPATYDRLYFDANRDLDLTNDPVLLPMEAPPAEFAPFGRSGTQMVTYDGLAIPFDYGSGLGVRPVRLIPRLTVYEFEGKLSGSLCFVATVARQGEVRIGPRQYGALLAQCYLITGRFDQPGTAMFLTPVNRSEQREYWLGSDEIVAMRRVDGNYYTTSVTPLGDKLTVKRYRGDFGLFKIGPDKRDLKKLSMRGSLRSETSAVAVGDPIDRAKSEANAITECNVPVGNYLPAYLSVEYGRLEIALSDNYHSDGGPRDLDRPRRYAFQIREDKPFVLDFSNKPEILFASPAKDQTLKPGDTLRVAAVLTDPGLGIMIRRLNDTGRNRKEILKFADGREQSYERPVSLDPKVTITNSSGKQVAEGKMPFG